MNLLLSITYQLTESTITLHKLININEDQRTADCLECGTVKIKRRTNGNWRCKTGWKKGSKIYRSKLRKQYQKPYTKYKKDKCEHCGFIPVHSCQLDVDHIDGNNENNNITNLQTLCANCHRLKTYLNKDWENKKEAPAQDFS